MSYTVGTHNGAVTAHRHSGHMVFLLLLMVQFQLWDMVMTHVFVNSGLVAEANRVMASLISNGSFVLFKLLGLAAVLPLLWFVYRKYPGIGLATASCLSAFYMGVIIWNFVVFFN